MVKRRQRDRTMQTRQLCVAAERMCQTRDAFALATGPICDHEKYRQFQHQRQQMQQQGRRGAISPLPIVQHKCQRARLCQSLHHGEAGEEYLVPGRLAFERLQALRGGALGMKPQQQGDKRSDVTRLSAKQIVDCSCHLPQGACLVLLLGDAQRIAHERAKRQVTDGFSIRDAGALHPAHTVGQCKGLRFGQQPRLAKPGLTHDTHNATNTFAMACHHSPQGRPFTAAADQLRTGIKPRLAVPGLRSLSDEFKHLDRQRLALDLARTERAAFHKG